MRLRLNAHGRSCAARQARLNERVPGSDERKSSARCTVRLARSFTSDRSDIEPDRSCIFQFPAPPWPCCWLWQPLLATPPASRCPERPLCAATGQGHADAALGGGLTPSAAIATSLPPGRGEEASQADVQIASRTAESGPEPRCHQYQSARGGGIGGLRSKAVDSTRASTRSSKPPTRATCAWMQPARPAPPRETTQAIVAQQLGAAGPGLVRRPWSARPGSKC